MALVNAPPLQPTAPQQDEWMDVLSELQKEMKEMRLYRQEMERDVRRRRGGLLPPDIGKRSLGKCNSRDTAREGILTIGKRC
jgi:hypothetical protein